jgi:hypothetical protein
MNTYITQVPDINIKFDRNLLSANTYKFDAEYLLKIAEWLEKKLLSSEYLKYPRTIIKIREQIKHFMELYERSKDEEREAKGKAFIKTKVPFYRPRFANGNEQRLFERLDDRRKTSKFDRKNNAVSKIGQTK